MKKSIQFLSLALTGVVLTGALTGCMKREEVNEDSNAGNSAMSQLYVSNYEGGFGRKWLDKAAERFEQMYANTSFEDGKMGVNVNINSSKNGTAGKSFIDGVLKGTDEVFFTEDAFYYSVVAAGAAADITDIVTQPLSEWGETKSIADKFETTLGEFFKMGEGADAKYYALPHYEAMNGIVYDVDLFNEKGFWMSPTGTFLAPIPDPADPMKYLRPTSGLGTGPDGAEGTYDDGLPRTYDEFFMLCDYMVNKGVTPFTFTGMHTGYSTSSLINFWADYEGKDQFLMNFTLDGTATNLVNSMAEKDGMPVNGKYGDMMPATKIDQTNAYLLHRQAGKYVALSFAKRANSNAKYIDSLSFSGSQSHLNAQSTYLGSRLTGAGNPIAFLLEGIWWENEADESGYFDQYSVYGETRATRQFGWMPVPKASEEFVGTNRTLFSTLNNSCSFVRANISSPQKMALAKKFLQFCHTDAEMQQFSVNTSTMKPLQYTVPADKMTSMSYFGRDIVAMRSNEKIDMVYAFSDADKFINNQDYFYRNTLAWKCSIGANPFSVFHDSPSTTVKSFFDKLPEEKQAMWEALS